MEYLVLSYKFTFFFGGDPKHIWQTHIW